METMSRQTEVETSLANIKYCVLIVRFAPSREIVFPRRYAHTVVRFLQKAAKIAKNRQHDVFAYFNKQRAGRGNHKETIFAGR